MSRRAVYNDTGRFLGFMYVSGGERFYAPVVGVSDEELSSYCDFNY